MDRKTFLGWVSRVDDLTDAQRANTMVIMSGGPHEGAAAAAIELAVGADRQCPHCQTPGAENRGMARGLRRYRCKACGKSFNALTATPLSRLRHKDQWLAFGQSLAEGETVDQAAKRCGGAHSTAFRWRHRFLEAEKRANAGSRTNSCRCLSRSIVAAPPSVRSCRPPMATPSRLSLSQSCRRTLSSSPMEERLWHPAPPR